MKTQKQGKFPVRERVLSVIGDQTLTARTLSYRAECSYSTLRAMVEDGLLDVVGREKPTSHMRAVQGVPILRAVRGGGRGAK